MAKKTFLKSTQNQPEKVVEKVVEKVIEKEVTFDTALDVVKEILASDPDKYAEFKAICKDSYYHAVRTSNIPLSQEKLNVLSATITEKFLQYLIK